MKRMTKWLCLLLAVMMLATSLIACADEQTEPETPDDTTDTPTTPTISPIPRRPTFWPICPRTTSAARSS